MGKRYHKLRSERHGALDFQGAKDPGPRTLRARNLARQYIVEQRLAPEAAAQLSELVKETAACPPVLREGLVFLPRPVCADLPEIPPPYGFKGGAARLLLAKVLSLTTHPTIPRDIDLVRVGEKWNAEDTELSRRLMPRDFERGNGVELVSTEERYFRTRDISINEVLVLGDEVRCTIACLLDTLGFVLRPCYYRSGSLHREAALPGRTLLKMLRLRAEGLEGGESWVVTGVPDDVEVGDFELALELNKALIRGRATAERFVSACAEGGLLSLGEAGELGQGERLVAIMCELSLGLYQGLEFFDALPLDLRREIEQAQRDRASR